MMSDQLPTLRLRGPFTVVHAPAGIDNNVNLAHDLPLFLFLFLFIQNPNRLVPASCTLLLVLANASLR